MGEVTTTRPTTTKAFKSKKGTKGKKKKGQTSTNPHTLVFMDIGGVTAEEVNAVSMEDILDTSTIKINLYDADMTPLPMGLNDLVKKELGEVYYYRGDPRLFHYPDGTVGVFIERTGVFYKLTEIEI